MSFVEGLIATAIGIAIVTIVPIKRLEK